ncbi:MAG: RNA polymerase sigma factor [Roseiflexaceae bacterium]
MYIIAVHHPSSGTSSDGFLIAEICQRHESALCVLYERYSQLMYAVAVRITGDESSAEEVVQDVFSAVWKSAAGFRPGSNVKAWLNAIARHRAIDATRVCHFRAHADAIRLDDVPFLCTPIETEMHVLDVLEREEIRQALLDLSPVQRTTLELSYYAGLSPVEIAAHTGVPLGTVKTRLRLGRSKLRTLLLQG